MFLISGSYSLTPSEGDALDLRTGKLENEAIVGSEKTKHPAFEAKSGSCRDEMFFNRETRFLWLTVTGVMLWTDRSKNDIVGIQLPKLVQRIF